MVEISEKISREVGDEMKRENVTNGEIEKRDRRETLGRTACIMFGFAVVSGDCYLVFYNKYFSGFKFGDSLLGCQRV
jgi:hypothetical protein